VAVTTEVIPDNTVRVLDHGFVRLDDAMADDLSVVNGARVSFARRKEEMDESDEGLIRFLMRDRHGTPFEHNSFRFHIRAPIFVAREWMRHRVGCLTGDAVVTFVNVNGVTGPQQRKTIDELWRMWSVGERNGHALPPDQRTDIERLAASGLSIRAIAQKVGTGRRAISSHLRGENEYRDGRWEVRRMRLRVLNEETGEFTVGHIAEIFDKGVQPVYRLTLADGSDLTATANHRLLTIEGWKTMEEAVGLSGRGADAAATRECHLMANGVRACQDASWLKARRRKGISEAHREAIRRARFGDRSNFWRGGVAPRRATLARWTTEQAPKVHAQYDYTCQACGKRGSRLHAHHIVPVWLDGDLASDIGNLISVCDGCHSAIHRTRETELKHLRRFSGWHGFARDIDVPHRQGYKLTAHPVKVLSVAYVGLRQTYDLSIEGPWHNFVANGVVVHNSFNEFSLRYAKATDDFYVPEAEDVRSQVGKPGAYSFEPVPDEVAEETREKLRAVYETAYWTYQELVELGVAREIARCVLPVGAYTEFYWTVNARSLMNFLSLRNAESAQREIRRYAKACERFLEQLMPVTYAAFVAAGRVAP
jgi:thymidylate synthase ThyX/5-methylcytosine-specific restriction endonuclease McrA